MKNFGPSYPSIFSSDNKEVEIAEYYGRFTPWLYVAACNIRNEKTVNVLLLLLGLNKFPIKQFKKNYIFNTSISTDPYQFFSVL